WRGREAERAALAQRLTEVERLAVRLERLVDEHAGGVLDELDVQSVRRDEVNHATHVRKPKLNEPAATLPEPAVLQQLRVVEISPLWRLCRGAGRQRLRFERRQQDHQL